MNDETRELYEFYEACQVGDPARLQERVNVNSEFPWYCGVLFSPTDGVYMSGWNCTRAPEHCGRHVAEGLGRIVAVEET